MKNFSYLAAKAIEEDLGSGDLTSQATVPAHLKARAKIYAKAKGVLAGLEWVEALYSKIDPDLQWQAFYKDGDQVSPGEAVAVVEGRAQSILAGERTALNLLMHLSGIATLTNKFVEKASSRGIQIYDTRKTIPLFRELEKYAVRMGGGKNHRMGLYDQMLVKENHIFCAGSPRKALELAKGRCPGGMKIEIEVESLEDLKEILPLEPHIVLLDNFSQPALQQALDLLRDYPLVEVEVSGGITLENLENYLLPGVHRIALGAITHSAPALDFSLLLEEKLE